MGDEEVPRMVFLSHQTWADYDIRQNPKAMLPVTRQHSYARLCGLLAHVPSRVDGLHLNTNLVPVSNFGRPHMHMHSLDTIILLLDILASK